MKWTHTYIPTLRDAPADAELISHQLLLRAGYIRRLAAGVYIYLPLMQRTLRKFSQIVREEMDAAGAIEITMPVLAPSAVWKKSGRYDTVGHIQMRLKDRGKREMILGGTHEEVVTTLITGELKSYRQLPINLYQIQAKFRDEIRPRFGLLRAREFIMKDAYSFDADQESHSKSYQKMVEAYFKVFERAGLDTKKVEADTGDMGGEGAHEFMVIVDTAGGEDTVFFCNKCDYAANVERATFRDSTPPDPDEKELPLEKIETPGASTIEQVTGFLKVDARKLAKTLIYKADGEMVAVMIRGDRELNEVKLKNHLGAKELEMAGPEMVEKLTGAPVGFAGPVGLKGAKIHIDNELALLKNFIVGANENDSHYLNANLGRDFESVGQGDLISASDGELCPACGAESGGKLWSKRGIEVGNTFMLGTKYSESMDAKFLGADGKQQPFIMGSYGIGITRTAQAAIERYHDDKGIIWPKAIAPYLVEIVPLNYEDEKLRAAADKVYSELTSAGFDVLLDDRPERAGVKLNDADLIGLPIRVTIGAKSLKEGKIEIKARSESEMILASLEDSVLVVRKMLEKLR